MKKRILGIAFLAGVVLMSGSQSNATPVTPELLKTMASADADQLIPVIVNLRDKTALLGLKSAMKGVPRSLHRQHMIQTLQGVADISQAPLRGLLNTRKASNIRTLWMINGIAFSAPAWLVQEVALQPEVERIALDSMVSVPPIAPVYAKTSEWNIDAISAPVLWNSGYTGEGVVVATMDTGVDVLHPDLASSWRGGTNSWFDPNNEHVSPTDADGHGTGTMGIIVGRSAGGTNIGVAPGAQWIAVKIFNDNGFATLSTIHEGFQWLLDPDGNPATDDAPDVVSNSWDLDGSLNTCAGEFEPDVQALRSAGIAVVFAAGNSGPSVLSSVSPANYPESFSVGAVDETFNIASFSSRGSSACSNAIYPDVVAPGVNIRIADLTFGGVLPDPYVYASGTSFSAPHVAGTMALLLSAFPDITIFELEQALRTAALDLGSTGPDNTYGNGLINAFAAFSALGGVATEWVSAPETPTGPLKVAVETAYLFSTGGAVSSIGDQVQYFFDWGDGTDSGWLSPGISNASKSWTLPGIYTVRTKARCGVHPLVSSNWSGAISVKVSKPVMVTVNSRGMFDGWVKESTKGSGFGGSVFQGMVRVGDDRKDRQFKTILSFNTSKIPPDAEILSATLKLTGKNVIGTNPFSLLGACYVDVKKGSFNKGSLQRADFESPASASQVAVISDPVANSMLSVGNLNVEGINTVNKGGITQLRLYFSVPSNDNGVSDSVVFYHGEAVSKTKRPKLEVTYLP